MLRSAELQISRLCSAKMGLRVPADLCCRELGHRLGRQGAFAHYKGLPTCRRPPSSAIRLKDAGRRQNPAMAGDFPPIHPQPQPGGKK